MALYYIGCLYCT
uniref:Uncharacterized protein n=1 Tax=Salix viminalis TaxID=40686 RepID=A0A6N2MNJ0_SALVM